ncbi:C40 family peptidase [Streptomyces syringium]|uniref:C40 family peptidase n=1 Tax=Streptomyces syringium TaxID=76729 RepID=UPI0033C4E5F4
MRNPAFTEEPPDSRGCPVCADAAAAAPARADGGDAAHTSGTGPLDGLPDGPVDEGADESGARHRCALRGAIVAAVGVAVIAGSGTGATAAPEPPDPVGGDSSVYEPGDPEDPALSGGPLADEPESDEPESQEEPGPEGAVPDGTAPDVAVPEGTAPGGAMTLEPPQGLAVPLSDQDIPGVAAPRGSLSPPLPADPARTPQAPTVAKPRLESAITFAMAQIGDPYKLGGNGPHVWDCSGLIQQAYRRAGVKLPRIAADQYRATKRITRRALRRGDLVFWSTNGKASGVHHAAIYLGGGKYLEAPRPGKKVRVSTFSYYRPNLYGRPR